MTSKFEGMTVSDESEILSASEQAFDHPRSDEGANTDSVVSLRDLIGDYNEKLTRMSGMIDQAANYEDISREDSERKKIKSVIAEKLAGVFDHPNPVDEDYKYLQELVDNIMGEDLQTDLSDGILQAYDRVSDIINKVAVSEERFGLDSQSRAYYISEYRRLKPIIREYLEPQNLVKKRNKREPSIFEAIVASVRLTEIKQEILANVADEADLVVVAGSLNWGRFFDTRGTGTTRYMKDSNFEQGDYRNHYEVDYSGEQPVVNVERKENDLSDVDITIVAKPDNNILEIYQSIFRDRTDQNADKNLKIITKFLELINNSDLDDQDRPVSINLDFVTDSGFTGQLVIFSNNGFRSLYKVDINDLEGIYQGEKTVSDGMPYHKRHAVKIKDFGNGNEDTGEAELFFHPNLDYREGSLDTVRKKASATGNFEQALIGGKQIYSEYPTKPVGEPILIDEDQGIYGQYYIKYYPFGGFYQDKTQEFGSYFLGFNPDNLILGQIALDNGDEIAEIAREFKERYFKRIIHEQKKLNGIKASDLRDMPAKVLFGPYLSRWARIPEYQRKKLFDEFNSYIEKTEGSAEETRTDSDYYLASIPTAESVQSIIEIQEKLERELGHEHLKIMGVDYLHLTEIYLPSIDKINSFLSSIGSKILIDKSVYEKIKSRASESDSRLRSFKVSDIKRIGKSAIALCFSEDSEFNQRIWEIFQEEVLKSGVDEHDFQSLISNDNFTFQFFSPPKHAAHVTIAKIDEVAADEPIDFDKLADWVRGMVIMFEDIEWRENS